MEREQIQFGGMVCDSRHNLPQGHPPLDTVRALHQTVVSLRAALEKSRAELDELRKHVQKHVENDNLNAKTDAINVNIVDEDVSKSVLKQNSDNLNLEDKKVSPEATSGTKKVDFDVTVEEISASEDSKSVTSGKSVHSERNYSDKITKNFENIQNLKLKSLTIVSASDKTSDTLPSVQKTEVTVDETSEEHAESDEDIEIPKIDLKSASCTTESSEDTKEYYNKPHKHHRIIISKFAMSSKIDVKIKVSSNVVPDSSDTDSNTNTPMNRSMESETIPNKEDELSRSGIQVNVTSEENLTVKSDSRENLNISRQSTDNLHLDVEDLSLRSMSDADNSVFSDGAETPCDGDDGEMDEGKMDTEEGPLDGTSGNESEEVDDIELIFTTDETKELSGLQEDLVSISDDCDSWQKPGKCGTPVLLKYKPIRPRDSSVDQIEPSESCDNLENENLENYNFQVNNYDKSPLLQINNGSNRMLEQKSMESTDSLSYDQQKSFDNTKSSSFERDSSLDQRDESFDHFEGLDNIRDGQEAGGLVQGHKHGRKWSHYNVLVETDISKCGILEEEFNPNLRRNTCPNPQPYRPIIHREAMNKTASNSRNVTPKFGRSPRLSRGVNQRPILGDRGGAKCENSAQTDISALPGQWRSESHLANKTIGGQYTLPSKFAIPGHCSKYSLRLSDKTQEARRVLLSDINFTSMVPELSRSADHLCQEGGRAPADEVHWKGGQYLRTPDYCRRGLTPSVSLTSPGCSRCEYTLGGVGMASRFRGSASDLCTSGARIRPSYSMHSCSKDLPRSRSKVTFQDSFNSNVRGSLPDLRFTHSNFSNATHIGPVCCDRHVHGMNPCYVGGSGSFHWRDSSGSTESLLEETEEYLRRSIDGILGDDKKRHRPKGKLRGGLKSTRSCGSTDVIEDKDRSPSRNSLPYLPRSSRELKLGQIIKIISSRGRVLTGKVRYIGIIAGTQTPGDYVGVELDSPSGDSNGKYLGKRFFQCEQKHAIFVTFNKVVMAWAPS